MLTIKQEEPIKAIERNIRAENLVRETKVLNIARLAKMLVDLFGLDEAFQKIGKKLEGQEIEMYLKELDGYITFILTSDRQKFECHTEKANNPIARIIITVKEEKIIMVISKIIRSKANLFGMMKLLKYILLGKTKIKGSLGATLKLVRCLMIGKNDVYKKRKEG
ncbi:MAG: hypothetical protein ACFE9P_09110 [Candidatus Hermodarchaeota archaeon]